jgi:protein-L-isoaspartate(D-aspartate) O-methyltransferase
VVVAGALLVLGPTACRGQGASTRAANETMKDHYQRSREALASSLAAEGIRNAEVLRAVRVVPRHQFVPPELASEAYDDRPLPIGAGQTISQPYVVAYMTEALGVARGDRVLEVGTGSGYQAAILAEIGAEVFSIEIVAELSQRARVALDRSGYERVRLRVGDGYAGWPSEAPFKAVMVTAAAERIPPPLVEQLAPNGRLVMPVEDSATGHQWIVVAEKDAEGNVSEHRTLPVRFVPMTGTAERGELH